MLRPFVSLLCFKDIAKLNNSQAWQDKILINMILAACIE